MTLKSPSSREANQREVFEGRIRAGAAVIHADPNTRLWRDDYLTGMQDDLKAEALQILLTAVTLEQFNQAKALVIASTKIGDVQSSLVKLAQPAEP
jgi:hypothetical protein